MNVREQNHKYQLPLLINIIKCYATWPTTKHATMLAPLHTYVFLPFPIILCMFVL